MKKLIIIGGGPAALILAAELDTKKYKVTLFDKKKTVGRKFLVAGEGGLNLTYNASLEALTNQYFPREFMAPVLRQFTNQDLMSWLNKHEIPTFIGSSNRVFPELGIKPIEVLNKITTYISDRDIAFQLGAKWEGWNEEGHLCFHEMEGVLADIVVFAMGGASWQVTGSDGDWRETFEANGVKVEPFRAANCAFEVDWDKTFISTHEGKPLKNIALSFDGHSSKGELNISKFGLEGNAIYALSQKIQEKLLDEESVLVHLDLKPTMTIDQLKAKYKRSHRSKVTDVLNKDLNLDRTAISLLKQCCDKDAFSNPDMLVKTIKSVPIVIKSAGELDEAISTLGGVALDEIDENFQLKKIPNSYAIGEMLDWYAPTGGYLLQGCFSMGFVLAKFLNALEDKE
ncbi:NAD(P)/FAD-dependent oxidoreductase [Cyclobacterium qasimii]|uniref:NAD(FAD)-utilizing dehydrogenase n=2 Tax=Cyclobacterium qasimii TaxID=1350429 RepID=S7VE94_9BACT|nr:TIGR03862 family flavoprotein [Cyclobacterium qasimii]EPR68555.1 NAD(FAD)-utilizing dehydrogenase [Cyclobacterium qasimii M12-11B]GEO20649.1 NAD(FAD)-utilizing dehydrogenase [Cyclobacterium qasimii]